MASQDHPQKSRSPSVSANNRSISPSPHPGYHHDATPGLGLNFSATTTFPDTTVFSNPTAQSTDTQSFAYSTGYLSPTPDPQSLASSDPFFPHGQSLGPSFNAGLVDNLDSSSNVRTLPQEESFSNLLNSNPTNFDFSLYPSSDSPAPTNNASNINTTQDFGSPLFLDSRLHQQQPQAVSQAINPVDLATQTPSPHASSPSPLSPHDPYQQQQQHTSPGALASPTSAPNPWSTPHHSRHASLGPTTASPYMGDQSDWQAVYHSSAFQQPHRAPSEVSDVSSAAHSPYMSQHESFDVSDNNSPSPLLAPQNDAGVHDNALGIESFTLSEQPGFSPAHSPYISPQLMPQPGPEMVPNVPFLSPPQPPNIQFPASPSDAPGGMDEVQLNSGLGDIGQASQMAPPSINVELAPPSRDNVYGAPSKMAADTDSLSPPIANPRAGRLRSKSDPYAHPISRSISPAASTSSSLEPFPSTSPRSLSPIGGRRQPASNPSSRDASPVRGHSRRVSTSSIDSRKAILDLADPQRTGANSNDPKRVQKHPATFQCSLCPKRFTRAYNLRSHLRTHTDERPFVCTVCGKAFARQHDRKRHEGLHTGEKKFICRGDLSNGRQWGCGRRFARADALGRHFRSEAGRMCIKPLLDEESHERHRSFVNDPHQQLSGHLQPISQPLMVPEMNGQSTGNFVLPAALLAQYPALQNLQWDQLSASTDDPSEFGHSGYDASSGGELGFDDDDPSVGGGYTSGQGAMYLDNQSHMFSQ